MQKGFDISEWNKRVYLKQALIGWYSFKCYRFLHNSEWEIEEHKANDLWNKLNSDMMSRLTDVCFDDRNSLENLEDYYLMMVNEGYSSVSQWLGQWIDDISRGMGYSANNNMYRRVEALEHASRISS